MSIILSKSPFIFEIQNASLEGGRVQIFLWKQGSSEPAIPQYSLSKLTPATNSESVFFDVSPYINEFINNKEFTANSSNLNFNLPIDEYVNIRIKLFTLIANSYTLYGNYVVNGFKGYLEQKNEINDFLDFDFLLDQKTYNYYNSNIPFGDITLYNKYSGDEQYFYKYTDLVNGDTYDYSINAAGWKKIFRVYPSYSAHGNKLEIISDINGLLATYYFRPVEECRYTPVTLDFVNKYGAWQREFLFKNSTDSINVESQSYKNYRAIPTTFIAQETLLTTFNTNGTESIKTNTGWVSEDFKDNLKQLLLSDRILINNRPATITTKQVELQKNINNKLINYALDFNFSNSII
jgi:hypothetical protein